MEIEEEIPTLKERRSTGTGRVAGWQAKSSGRPVPSEERPRRRQQSPQLSEAAQKLLWPASETSFCISHFAYPIPYPTLKITFKKWDIPLISREKLNTVIYLGIVFVDEHRKQGVR